MKITNLTIALLFPLALAACGKTNPPVTNPDLTTTNPDLTMASDMASGMPAPPVLGNIIDRMGRAGVNTALTNPFSLPLGVLMNKTSDQVKNEYNQGPSAGDPTKWKAAYSAEIAINIAVLDGLDNNCGNQFAYGLGMTYDTLAGALSDDEIYINTATGTCAQYLGVEAMSLSGMPLTDCGGRTPLYNTIDVTYSALAIGKLAGIMNGITVDGEGNANATTFPFLGAPNN